MDKIEKDPPKNFILMLVPVTRDLDKIILKILKSYQTYLPICGICHQMCGAVSIKTDQKAFPPRENSQKNIKIYIKNS